MSCVVKGDIFPIVFINARGGDDRSSQISADIFNGNIGSTQVGFCAYIKAISMIFVNIILDFAERRSDGCSQFFEKNLAKSIAQEGIIKVFDVSPGSENTGTAFGDKGMDVRVPF